MRLKRNKPPGRRADPHCNQLTLPWTAPAVQTAAWQVMTVLLFMERSAQWRASDAYMRSKRTTPDHRALPRLRGSGPGSSASSLRKKPILR